MTNDTDIEVMAGAIFFSGKGKWSITPYHVNKKTRELAESWWSNPPNQDMRDDKDLAYLKAKAALAASPVERLRTEMATAIRLIGEGHQDHAAERLKQALLKLPEDIRNGKHNIDRN